MIIKSERIIREGQHAILIVFPRGFGLQNRRNNPTTYLEDKLKLWIVEHHSGFSFRTIGQRPAMFATYRFESDSMKRISDIQSAKEN